jgi:hypothetical protein
LKEFSQFRAGAFSDPPKPDLGIGSFAEFLLAAEPLLLILLEYLEIRALQDDLNLELCFLDLALPFLSPVE